MIVTRIVEVAVNTNFRAYMQHKKANNNHLLSEVAGVSASEQKFSVEYRPLADFLALVPGANITKANALNWVMSEGLMQASLGREQLLKLVNESLSGFFQAAKTPTQMNPPQQNVVGAGLPAKKAVGEMAFNAQDAFGLDPFDDRDIDKQITVHDLFSEIAWERHKNYFDEAEKQFKTKYGVGVLEYYRQNFEPKYMIIDLGGDQGKRFRFDLEEIRKEAQKRGIKPFYFGGFNGYIQFLEKGDWKPEVQKRATFEPNEQYGFDVSPVRTRNSDGSFEVNMENIKKIRNGNVQYHFHGGAFTPSKERALNLISNMNLYFIRAAAKDPNIDEEDKKYLDSISNLIETMNKSKKDLKKIGNFNKNDAFKPISYLPVDMDTFTNIVWSGLFGTFKNFGKGTFTKIEEVGIQVDNVDNQKNHENKVYWNYSKKNQNKIDFKLSDEQAREVFNFIFEPVEEYETFRSWFRWKDVPSLEAMGPVNDNIKFGLDTIVKNGINANPSIKESLNRTVYSINNIQSKKFAISLQEKKIPLEKDPNPYSSDVDPKIQSLIDNDFSWELTEKERKEGHKTPFQDLYDQKEGAKKIGWLKHPSGIRVRIQLESGKWYMYLPTESGNKYELPTNYGNDPHSLLLAKKGSVLSGGIKSGHITANPAGPKTWKKILERLRMGYNGGLGEYYRKSGSQEPKDPNQNFLNPEDWLKMPSIVEGANMAKSHFNAQYSGSIGWFESNMALFGGSGDIKVPSDVFEKTELLNWAYEGLHLFSNDPAFQIGFTNQEEFDYFTGHQDSRKKVGKNLFKKIDLEKEREKGNKGKGIEALYSMFNIYDTDEEDIDPDTAEQGRKEIFNTIQNYIKDIKSGIKQTKNAGDIFILPKIKEANPIVATALATNGFMFRVRMVSKYVLGQMKKRLAEISKEAKISMPRSKDETGADKEVEFSQNDRANERGEYGSSDEELKVFNINNLYKILGEKPPEHDPSSIQDDNQLSAKSNFSILQKQDVSQINKTNGTQGQVHSNIRTNVAIPVQKTNSISQNQEPKSTLSPENLERLHKILSKKPKDFAVNQPVNPVQKPTQIASIGTQETKPTQIASMSTQDYVQEPKSTLSPENLERLRKILSKKPNNQKKLEHFKGFDQWRKMQEMIGTSVVFDSKKSKPKDGDGFNWWGAPGNLGGTLISGEANTSKSDPNGKKGLRNGRKTKRTK